MPKKRRAADEEVPLYLGLTPNQVVAYNLTEARMLKGWTQEQAAEALEPHLGTRWSKASVSQAERSVAGRFVRNFSADEIVAFARTFDLPVTWFFMPPPTWSGPPGVPVKLSVPDEERFGVALTELADLVFGDEDDQALLTMRLDRFLADLGPMPLSQAQQRVADLVQHHIGAVVRDSFRSLELWQDRLRNLANQLEDLQTRANRQVLGELFGGDRDEPPGLETDGPGQGAE